jgi:hypothetical protein
MSPSPPPSSQADSRSPRASPLSVSAPPSLRRVSFGDSRENSPVRQRSQSRGRMSARFSLASVSSSILEMMRSVSGTSRERHQLNRGGNDHFHFPHHPLGNVEEVSGSDSNNYKHSGDGWQVFKKGMVLILNIYSSCRVIKLQGHTPTLFLFPFPLTCLPPYIASMVLSHGT